MSTICKICGKHKQKVRCPDCSGILGFFSSSCERCNSTKYILECPDQKDHDLEERLNAIGKELCRRKKNNRIKEPKPSYPLGPPLQREFCWKCHGKGFIDEWVEVTNILTPWPPTRREKKTVRCPVCNRGY